MEPIKLRGRGTAENPANRFVPLSYQPDAEARDPDDPGPRTRFYRDTARAIIASNDSPDVGFTHSINPYRGCEHGCPYCLGGETSILMGDGTTRRLDQLAVGDEIYGTRQVGHYRYYLRTRVLAHWRTMKPAYRLTLADGTELVASGDHRFHTERGWKYVTDSDRPGEQRPHLTANNTLSGTGRFSPGPMHDEEYQRGYLCGRVGGDALPASYSYARAGRTPGDQHQFRLALADREPLARSAAFLRARGMSPATVRFRRAEVGEIREIGAWPGEASEQWSKGYLAGIFDAQGSYSGGVLRICDTDPEIIATVAESLARFGFDFALETPARVSGEPVAVVRVRGGLREHLRFFHLTDPAIRRKRDIEGQAVKSAADLRVVSVEPLGLDLPLYDITTGTGDFIADGVVSHNCYARPTHEYLGLSAGLDFETRIFVKEDAPELLRRELSSRRWTPTPIGISGVTDAYQPVERRLGLTRRCLAVLADFRNPVGIVTKNHLVTRDADLLAELAGHGAARVFLSITTLDEALQRVMEPRASTPQRRLDALRTLSAAGVPVGVLVAPCIPGLTDHELPAILEAAAAAGARSAGFIPLRLPHAVAELFSGWLEAHFPERKEKVLHRIREIRGGKLNDARFGARMRGEGVYAEQLRALFHVAARRAGLNRERVELSTAAFRRPDPGGQTSLFD